MAIEFLLSVIASSAGTAALLSGAALLFRKQISHWLSKDLERLKNQYAKDLEAYRVSLIAETERIKAHQEVKKAGALLVIERKYKALMELHDSVEGVAADLFSTASMKGVAKTTRYADATQERLKRIANAHSAARPFLTDAESVALTSLKKSVVQCYGIILGRTSFPAEQAEQDAMLEEFGRKEFAVLSSTTAKINEMAKA
ncbi:MAG: hypothetical protein EOO32_00115 [Comamonadaceae bacterium]|nr:MAG: hypothetical protein EOO32_00115 [Comamonadaceae bacterium]